MYFLDAIVSSMALRYRSNPSFNIPPAPPPPRHTPDIWHLWRPGKEGIWSPCIQGGEFKLQPRSISYAISGVASYHGGRGVGGFSWKRLFLCGQLVTRRWFKQALCRIWRYLNFNIFDIGFRLWIQLFRERLSEKVHATIPKGIVGGFEFAVLQRNLKEWHKRLWTYVCEC